MGKLALGNSDISAVYLGANELLRVYLGNEVIYDKRAFDISTQNLIDKAVSLGYSTPSNIYALDDLIKGMKNIGLWDSLDVFYLFSSDLGNYAPFRLLNIINPDTFEAVGYGGLEWTGRGVKSNGTNSYIDTTFTPFRTMTKKYQQNNASRIAVVTDLSSSSNITSNIIDGLSYTTEQNTMFNENTSGVQKINSGGSAGVVGNYSGLGLKSISRRLSTEVELINKQDIEVKPLESVTFNVPNSQLIFRRSSGGSAGISQLGIGCYIMGEYVNNSIIQQFRTIFNNYLTAIGQTPIA